MAVVPTFKQQCPSCEAMISIKETMIGKKVECTKCKDKFIAEKPDDEDEPKASVKKDAKTGVKKTTEVGAGKRPKVEIVEDDDEDEDDDEKPQVKSTRNKGAANGKPKKGRDDDAEDADDVPAKKKKKAAAGSNTFLISVAAVGVVALVVAAIVLIRPWGRSNSVNPNPIPINPDGNPNVNIDKKDPPKPIDLVYGPSPIAMNDAEFARLSNLLPGDVEHVFRVSFGNLFAEKGSLLKPVFETPGALDNSALRKKLGFSLLSIDEMITAEKYSAPGWKFTVIHFKDFINENALKTALNLSVAAKPLDGQVYYRTTEPHPYFDQLGRFSFGIPNFLRYFDQQVERTSVVRIHNPQTLIVGDEAPVIAFLKAKGNFPPAKQSAVSALPHPEGPRYSFTGFEQEGGGVAKNLEGTNWEGASNNMTLRVTLDTGGMAKVAGVFPAPIAGSWQTMDGVNLTIFFPAPKLTFKVAVNGDMLVGTGSDVNKNSWKVAFTRVGQAAKDPNAKDPNAKDPNAKDPSPPDPTPKTIPTPTPAPGAQGQTYLTIKPELKAILDRMESRGASGKDKVYFSSATDMNAALIEIKLPDLKDTVVRKPRQFWDVTLMLFERKPRVRYLGTGLVQHETLQYQLRNELSCTQDLDAKEFQQDLGGRVAPLIAKFIQAVVRHEVRVVAPPAAKKEGVEDKKVEVTASQIMVGQQASTVEFVLDLLFDPPAVARVQSIVALTASVLSGEMDAAASASLRHGLAGAGKQLGGKGLSQMNIEPGRYPPGAFPRSKKTASYPDREPKNRISWMAGLLPYLGHQNLFDRIRFDQSWRDPGNWMAGNTIVPQFLDPMYPDYARQIAIGDLPLDFATTHYVGIAGVGLDAAAYKRGDPATKHKQGVLSYDGSATLDEIREGRGLANTILMIQVPHDGVTGVSPWIAGGGATLRGVPEKKSIAPFILTTDKNNKPIQQDKKNGTYVLMTDGSVRFIDQSVSDDVFKAIATITGPAPADFDLNKNPNTPLVAPLGDKSVKKPVEKAPVKTEPEKKPAESDKQPVKTDAEKKPSPPPDGKDVAPKKTSRLHPFGREPMENVCAMAVVSSAFPFAVRQNESGRLA